MLSHYLKKGLFLPILLFLHISIYAQTGSISGKILDDKQAGLAATTVRLIGGPVAVRASDDGNFLLPNLASVSCGSASCCKGSGQSSGTRRERCRR